MRLDETDLQILRLISEGVTVDGAARRVSLSERTVRRRLSSIATEMGVGTTIEAVVTAVRRGLI
nr:LuxR C-terminal-related transcriptional regulator [Nocardioides flavescens]